MKTREELKIDECPDDVSRFVGLFAPQALVQTGQLSSGSSCQDLGDTKREGRIRGRAAALHMLYDGPCGEHKRRERKAHSSAPRADQGRGLLPTGSLAEKLPITKENFTYSASERETLLGGCP